MNLFGTVLTYTAPTANYRGESEQNRTPIQKITDANHDYVIISPEAMRNALREILASYGLPTNRTRLKNEEQLAVKFADFPNSEKYVDDFFFGYLVAKRKEVTAALEKAGRDATNFNFKGDSIIRMNIAQSIEPYRNNTVFTQSPLTMKSENGPNWQNSEKSALLQREIALAAFQYPFGLNLNDCKSHPEWTKSLLNAIGELNGVAGNHARSYFEMAPASIVMRLTKQLVCGYNSYGFNSDGNNPEVIDGILQGDYPGDEFFIGGKIIKTMNAKTLKELSDKGVTIDRNPQRILATIGNKAFPVKGIKS